MKTIVRSAFTAVLLLLPVPDAQAFTLTQFWQQTLAHDPQIQVYRRKLEVAAQAQPLALSALLPHISAGASVQWAQDNNLSPEDSYAPDGALLLTPLLEKTQARTASWSVQLKQALFNWSALRNYQASGDQVAAAAATYQGSMQSLEQRVIESYVQWLLAYANVQNIQAAERGFARQAFTARARYRAGTTGILGAEEAQVALRKIQAQLAEAQAHWQAARATLRKFTGKPAPDQAPPLPRSLRVPSLALPVWKKQAVIHNPALAAARDQLAASRKQISAAMGGFFPSLSLILVHQWQSEHGTLGYQLGPLAASDLANPNRDINSSIMLRLRWPLFSGGAQQATLDKAQYRQEENFQTLLATQRSIDQTLRKNFARLAGARQQVRLYKQSLVVAERATRAAEAGVRVGLVSENNAIIDRQNVLQVQTALNAAMTSLVSAYARLAATAGTLTPRQIARLSLSLSQREEKQP